MKDLLGRIEKRLYAIPARNPAYISAMPETLGQILSREMLRKIAQEAAIEAREAVARWMMANSYATGHGDTIEDLLAELAGQIRGPEPSSITLHEGEEFVVEWRKP